METISVREFARRDGCSHTLVMRAIDRGRLRVGEDGRPLAEDVGTGWRKANRHRPPASICPTCRRPLANA